MYGRADRRIFKLQYLKGDTMKRKIHLKKRNKFNLKKVPKINIIIIRYIINIIFNISV